ncbi:MAG: GtrA family protein [Sciscionella sp.]|nr:GtrA family protein [Sciscionella sp.]
MAMIDTLLKQVPEPLRGKLIKHREMLKFAIVGSITWVITTVIWYGLKLTVLPAKPITAQAIAIIIATIVSYVLSREWSFRTRAGREAHHEAALFFVVSGIAVGLNLVPTAISRYVFHLQVPHVSMVTQELADFVFGMIIGTLIAMVFRFWAFKKWVFPDELGQRRSDGWVRQLRSVDQPDSDDTGRVA